ncbi:MULTISPECIES: hypothetical protein [unclassified Agrococcus]|uniref:hypothetical protein n=1 Tax=unclassified Agrococcus TaxID=2615065 RepID=UPI0036136A9E
MPRRLPIAILAVLWATALAGCSADPAPSSTPSAAASDAPCPGSPGATVATPSVAVTAADLCAIDGLDWQDAGAGSPVSAYASADEPCRATAQQTQQLVSSLDGRLSSLLSTGGDDGATVVRIGVAEGERAMAIGTALDGIVDACGAEAAPSNAFALAEIASVDGWSGLRIEGSGPAVEQHWRVDGTTLSLVEVPIGTPASVLETATAAQDALLDEPRADVAGDPCDASGSSAEEGRAPSAADLCAIDQQPWVPAGAQPLLDLQPRLTTSPACVAAHDAYASASSILLSSPLRIGTDLSLDRTALFAAPILEGEDASIAAALDGIAAGCPGATATWETGGQSFAALDVPGWSGIRVTSTSTQPLVPAAPEVDVLWRVVDGAVAVVQVPTELGEDVRQVALDAQLAALEG